MRLANENKVIDTSTNIYILNHLQLLLNAIHWVCIMSESSYHQSDRQSASNTEMPGALTTHRFPDSHQVVGLQPYIAMAAHECR